MKVRIRIDRLVLDGLGVPYGARDAVRTGLEHELARLVADGGLATSLAGATGGIALPSLDAPSIDAPEPSARLGAAIAGSVYGSIGAPRRSQR